MLKHVRFISIAMVLFAAVLIGNVVEATTTVVGNVTGTTYQNTSYWYANTSSTVSYFQLNANIRWFGAGQLTPKDERQNTCFYCTTLPSQPFVFNGFGSHPTRHLAQSTSSSVLFAFFSADTNYAADADCWDDGRKNGNYC
ncbi:MAG: hypothetical protein SF029_12315 [bacterium]|nr:hypothetical protein [bacterium]